MGRKMQSPISVRSTSRGRSITKIMTRMFLAGIQMSTGILENMCKDRSEHRCHMPSMYSDSTVMSLSVNPGECRCCDSHNPLCFIFPTGEYCPSQLSEAWHIRHDDKVPISLLSRPVLPILSASSSTGMYLNEKFSWNNLVISCSVFFFKLNVPQVRISLSLLCCSKINVPHL